MEGGGETGSGPVNMIREKEKKDYRTLVTGRLCEKRGNAMFLEDGKRQVRTQYMTIEMMNSIIIMTMMIISIITVVIVE
jgi:hypothetical protein